jgi:integrase
MSEFHSCFAKKLKEYVGFRCSLGFSRDHQNHLLKFDQYCIQFHPTACVLTAELVKGWIKYEVNSQHGSIQHKQSAIRGFAKFLGPDAYFLTENYGTHKRNFKPYLLSDYELTTFFAVADNLERPWDPFYAESAGVIFRLLYTCGLRPPEVRKIRRKDINFKTGEIFINQSKQSKDRIVVASCDMTALMKQYDYRRRIFCGDTEEFFIHTDGRPITSEQLADLTRLCWELANPDVPSAELPRLRPYDFRHLFASTVLQTWIDEGKNLYAQLPYLRAYMGHEDFRDTLYYVHILPERILMSNAIDWAQIESVGLEDSVWNQ